MAGPILNDPPYCTPTAEATGALTHDDFMALLKSAADEAYLQPILEAGDGNGLEVFGQAIEQFVRVSQAIERTTQAMYLLPWSGQTCEEAMGARAAQVPLLFTRGLAYAHIAIVIDPSVYVQEVEIEPSTPTGVEVLPGRRYALDAPLVFNPGVTGSMYGRGIAERTGYGYNNPRPGTITRYAQDGVGLSNNGASVAVSGDGVSIVARNVPDVFVAAHVGQYVLMTGGSNAGKVGRVISYSGPNPEAGTGGTVLIEQVITVRDEISGEFIPGEPVTQTGTGARGHVLAQSGSGTVRTLTIAQDIGVFASSGTITGDRSGATTALLRVADGSGYDAPGWVAEVGTASWRVLDWEEDLGISVTNTAQPSGGRSGLLDELGRERGVPRLHSETDDVYRTRIAEVADVVSPLAIRRTIQRTLAPYGMSGRLLEVGTDDFPGFFYDAGASSDPVRTRSHNFAYDMATLADRWKVYLDDAESRGFFVVEISRSAVGDFGFAYDVHPSGAYDLLAEGVGFYDGWPREAALARRRLWDALRAAVATGVGFAFVEAP